MSRCRQEDEVLLRYQDCVIRRSDVLTLRGNGWLNDAIIGFYFVFLKQERFQSNSELLFVGPEVTQCLKESPSCEMPIFLDPLEAKNKKYIFFAVNNSEQSHGGSHWSLMVYSVTSNTFYHQDSSSQSNGESAVKLAYNLQKYFSPSAEFHFEDMISRQQDNSYDCGIYLICNLENIVEHLTKGISDFEDIPLIKRDVVNGRRVLLSDLIMERENKNK